MFICVTVWLISVLSFASAIEDRKYEAQKFMEFCESFDLKVFVESNCVMNNVTVFFELFDPIYKDCFYIYNVCLTEEEEVVDFYRVEYNSTEQAASQEFQNVSDGVYGIYIEPVCTIQMCPRMIIEYEENISVSDCKRCNSFNLTILAYGNCEMNIIFVSFEVKDSSQNDCFHFYIIYLRRGEEVVDSVKVEYNKTENKVSHEFQNVTFGAYAIYIEPVCNSCRRMHIYYNELINLTESYCILPTNKSEPFPKLLEKIVQIPENETSFQRLMEKPGAIYGITSALLLVVGALIAYCCCSAGKRQSNNTLPNPAIVKNRETLRDTRIAQNIVVYILHYYDKREAVKRKVEVLKDFLFKLSYFADVRVIEDELPVILFDINHWLNNVLGERGIDGTVNRIILIASHEEKETDSDGDQIENLIFAEFVKRLNDDLERCLTGYDNLFVVQLDGSLPCSERFRNIVRRDRYSLSRESICNHMTDLCLNLCFGLPLDVQNAEERIKNLLLAHPVMHLEMLP